MNITNFAPSVESSTPIAVESNGQSKVLSHGPSLMEGFGSPEEQLNDELSSDRILNLRTSGCEQFIDNLEIPDTRDLWIPGYRLITEPLAREVGLRGMTDDPFPDLELEEEQPASAGIAGNVVETFVDGVTGQQKIDVLNASLLAQLAANVRYSRFDNPVQWSNRYGSVLMNLAWVVPKFSFRGISVGSRRFTMDKVILKLAARFLTSNQMATLTDAIEAMKALESDDRRIVIFERNSKRQNEGNFQFNSVGTSAQGTLSMKFNAYAFDTNTNVTNILWFSFSGNRTKLQVSDSTFVLNEQVYSRIRDRVVDKLGNHGLNYIAGLDISENL